MNTQQSQRGVGLLYEMLRSFVSLAETLNLSQTVRALGSTRQTVRRHIAALEQARGHALFTVQDRQYALTEEGRKALPEADELLQRGLAWFEARLGHVDGLQHYSHVVPQGATYHLQQHGLNRLWHGEAGVLSDGVAAWAQAQGQLDHEAFAELRGYCLVFRQVQGRWLVTEVGEKSAFAQWFGPTWARSSIGTPIDSLPGGERYNAVTARAYQDIQATHGLRYDHAVAGFTGGPSETHNIIAFERLLLGGSYPDKSPAVVSLARITPHVEIEAMPHDLMALLMSDKKLKEWVSTQD